MPVLISSDDAGRMVLKGELTIYTVAEVKAGIGDSLKDRDEIEIDLSGVTEIDTAGLQLMLIAKRKPGKHVRFLNHPPSVLRLLDLSNLATTLGDPVVLTAGERDGERP